MIVASPHTLQCAVRYALGKPPYVTGEVMADVLRSYIDLSVDDRRQIVQDIDSAITQDIAGTPEDVRQWRALQAVLT